MDLSPSVPSHQPAITASQHPNCDASPFAALPSDITLIIFSYFLPRPLILVISRVCKRWRTGALRSVTALSVSRSDELGAILARFACLTELDMAAPALTVTLPASITRLSLDLFSAVPLSSPVISAPLRHFKYYPSAPSFVLPILTLSLTTLCSLEFYWGISQPIDQYFSTANFPALTSLTLFLSGLLPPCPHQQNVLSFLRTHSTQLTSLTVRGSAVARFGQFPYPRLRQLSLQLRDMRGEDIVELLGNSTQLVDWTFADKQPCLTCSIPPSLLTSLTDLTLPFPLVPRHEAFIVQHLPRLRVIQASCFLDVPQSLRRFVTHALLRRQRIKCEEISRTAWELLQDNASLTRVTALTIDSTPPLELRLSQLYLPLLTDLDFDASQCSTDATIATLRLFLLSCKASLRRVALRPAESLWANAVAMRELVAIAREATAKIELFRPRGGVLAESFRIVELAWVNVKR